MKFTKYDNEKARFDLIDPEFELELANLLTLGAKKYTPDNWKLAEPAEATQRYRAALRRHENAMARGEVTDPETGVAHSVAIACNAMFLRYFERKGG